MAAQAHEPAEDGARISALEARILAEFDARQVAWADSLRQDAVESVGRLRWRQQVGGVLVPVHAMWVVPLLRAADALAARFVGEAGPGLAAPEPEPPGQPVAPREADIVVARGLLEGSLRFRRRFEATVTAHTARLHEERLRPWFRQRLAASRAKPPG